MSAYVSFECVRHGFVDVDTSSVGCPECETESVKRQVTEGQIAVLEDLCHHAIPMKHSNTYPVEAAPKALLLDMIAALRKEIENE